VMAQASVSPRNSIVDRTVAKRWWNRLACGDCEPPGPHRARMTPGALSALRAAGQRGRVVEQDEPAAAAPDSPLVEHDGLGLALVQPWFQSADGLAERKCGSRRHRRWKVLVGRLLRVIIPTEAHIDEPLRQSWPANDNAPTNRPPNVPGNRVSTE